ncbi:putative uncharacterized protein [Burkholderiales bacterium GJ-E10]|nr:putative uncharacterized protein [Burkholderiales bacterium GJ-E10]
MKPGRNDPCPCGSGRKFKHCCLAQAQQPGERDILWRRLRREIDPLNNELVNEALHRFGDLGLEEAWNEFLLWPQYEFDDDNENDGDESDGPLFIPFDEDSPYVPVFLSWFVYEWRPDPEDTSVPEREHAATAAHTYLQRKGKRLGATARGYIEACMAASFSFHEVLRCDPGQGFRLRDILSGTEIEVLERSGSQASRPGDILYAKIVPIEGTALMEACTPVMIPPRYKPELIELRRAIAAPPVGPGDPTDAQRRRDRSMELRETFLGIADELLNPQVPEMRNTDGDPIEFHTLRFDTADAEAALAALRDLAQGMDDESFDAGVERNAQDRLLRAEFPWLHAGNAAAPSLPNTTMGNITIDGNGHITAEVNSAARAAALRAIIETKLPGAQAQPSEVQSLQEMMAQADTPTGRARARQREAESAQLHAQPEVQAMLQASMRRHYEAWLDEDIPALGNRTPRQAVQDADGRESVEALLRQIERDAQDQRIPMDPRLVDDLRKELGIAP